MKKPNGYRWGLSTGFAAGAALINLLDGNTGFTIIWGVVDE